jgi:hypothetical protein
MLVTATTFVALFVILCVSLYVICMLVVMISTHHEQMWNDTCAQDECEEPSAGKTISKNGE